MEVSVMFSASRTAHCGHVIKTEIKSAMETEEVLQFRIGWPIEEFMDFKQS